MSKFTSISDAFGPLLGARGCQFLARSSTYPGLASSICSVDDRVPKLGLSPLAQVATNTGLRPVGFLRRGDRVLTRDNGFQPVRWVGTATYSGEGTRAAVVFGPGSLGNDRPLYVSAQHRMLLRTQDVVLLTGQTEVLIPAQKFVDGDHVRLVADRHVSFAHILLDAHQLIQIDGLWVESMFAPDMTDRVATETVDLSFTHSVAQYQTRHEQTARLVLQDQIGALLARPGSGKGRAYTKKGPAKRRGKVGALHQAAGTGGKL